MNRLCKDGNDKAERVLQTDKRRIFTAVGKMEKLCGTGNGHIPLCMCVCVCFKLSGAEMNWVRAEQKD